MGNPLEFVTVHLRQHDVAHDEIRRLASDQPRDLLFRPLQAGQPNPSVLEIRRCAPEWSSHHRSLRQPVIQLLFVAWYLA